MKINRDDIIPCKYISTYSVSYYLISSEQFPKVVSESWIREQKEQKLYSWACFAMFKSHMEDFKKAYTKFPNRIILLLDFKGSKKLLPLTDFEIRTWIRLCHKFFLIPKPNLTEILDNHLYVVDLGSLSRNRMYLYLTVIRYLIDAPALVRTTLNLCKKYRVDFLLAFVIAHNTSNPNSGHSVANISSYGKGNNIGGIIVDQTMIDYTAKLGNIKGQPLGKCMFDELNSEYCSRSFSLQSTIASIQVPTNEKLSGGISFVNIADSEANKEFLKSRRKLGTVGVMGVGG